MKVTCSLYALTCLSFAFGSLAAVTLSLAVSTDAWLFMSEPTLVQVENYTDPFHVLIDIRFGFWRVCTINIAGGTLPDQCIGIDYKQQGSGRGDGAPTGMSIVGATRIAAPFVVIALVVGFAAIVFHVTGSIQGDYKTLIAGVMYILSGLVLAIGIILFISAINDEIGYRTTKKNEDFTFTYRYGWSFLMAGISFVASELGAVVCVTIFLRRHSKMTDMIELIPGLEKQLEKDQDRVDTYTWRTNEDQTILYMG